MPGIMMLMLVKNISSSFINQILCILPLRKRTACAQEMFIATMKTIITKKQSMQLKREEGWYSAAEMSADLGWST